MPTITASCNGESATASYTAPSPAPTASYVVGGRCNDVSFATMSATIGPVKVTRLFYSGALPTTYDRQGIPAGVKLVISYKTPDTNVAAFVSSIPATDDVEMCYHHEPEGDYTSGSTFVTEFDRQATTGRKANPAVPWAFIAGLYQYSTGLAGYDGSFIPTQQDYNYADSYLRNANQLVPMSQEPRITRYRTLLSARGLTWHGCTEYGRGVIPVGSTFDQPTADARVSVINADAQWLPTIPGVRIWSYWYGQAANGDQWRFPDAASAAAWQAAAAPTTSRAR